MRFEDAFLLFLGGVLAWAFVYTEWMKRRDRDEERRHGFDVIRKE
jgi:hypothetical protein